MGWTLSRRVWLILGLAIPLAILLLYLNSRRPVPQVAVVQVQRKDISSSISTNGKVEPVQPYYLRAKFDGFVKQVQVAENQTVRQGQVLLTLDDADIRAQLDQARAQLTSEQDDLRSAKSGGRPDQAAHANDELRSAIAQRDLLAKQQDSLTRLAGEKAATPDEVAKNRAALERADAEVDQLREAKQQFTHQVGTDQQRLALKVSELQQEVAALQEKVNSARVTAPIAGALVALPVHARDFVHTGDLLAEVADLRQVRVRAYIDEPELGQLEPNQPVEITWDALPGRVWMGRTESLPRQVVARGARSVGEVLCSVSDGQTALIPNTTVDVRILLNMRQNVLTVPRGAVEIEGSRRYVYRVESERLHRAEIKVGIANATEYEVLSGLKEGDTVALPGDAPLRDNRAVRVVSPE
jgi:HlyD family secretion protein